MDISMDFIHWFINLLIKKSFARTVQNKIMYNKELAEEILHKKFIRKCEKIKKSL